MLRGVSQSACQALAGSRWHWARDMSYYRPRPPPGCVRTNSYNAWMYDTGAGSGGNCGDDRKSCVCTCPPGRYSDGSAYLEEECKQCSPGGVTLSYTTTLLLSFVRIYSVNITPSLFFSLPFVLLPNSLLLSSQRPLCCEYRLGVSSMSSR